MVIRLRVSCCIQRDFTLIKSTVRVSLFQTGHLCLRTSSLLVFDIFFSIKTCFTVSRPVLCPEYLGVSSLGKCSCLHFKRTQIKLDYKIAE